MANYYPAMLDLRGRRARVVGSPLGAAAPNAERCACGGVEKAAALHSCGAEVTLQCSALCAEAHALAVQTPLTVLTKAYTPGDLAGAAIVVAATTYDRVTSEAVRAEASERGQLLNIVDLPELCDFIVPSIVRRGPLTIAVSTEGTSPGLAKRIRQRLERLFPPTYDTYMQLAAAARLLLRHAGISYARRDEFFGDYDASTVLDRLSEGDRAGAQAETATLLERYGVSIAPGDLPLEQPLEVAR